MKKLIINIILIVVIVLACFNFYKSALERFAIREGEIDYNEYSKLYYYNQLNDEQKKIYAYIDVALDNLESDIQLGITKNENVASDVQKALDAIYNDRPEYYFLPSEYNVKTLDLWIVNYVAIKIDLGVDDYIERNQKDFEMEQAIKQILDSAVSYDMSDVEKEIAIHDYLLKQVKYYDYVDMKDIPREKHTAYGALVGKEAVCDGISKAMMLLLNRVGIDTIMILGSVKGVPHAWNVVELDGEYYHLDATSDTIDLNGEKHVIHTHFNITDEVINQTHNISEGFNVVKCTSAKYNYYAYNDYRVGYTESIKNKLSKIISNQSESSVLEVSVDELYSTNEILEALYFLDFSNWQTERKTNVSYHNHANIYIFENVN